MRHCSLFKLSHCVKELSRSWSKSSVLASSVSLNQPYVKMLHYETSDLSINMLPHWDRKGPGSQSTHIRKFHKLPVIKTILYSNCPEQHALFQHASHLKLLPCVHNQLSRPLANVSSGSDKSQPSKHQQRPRKSSVKEFNFKGKIGEHDLNIKINKIKGLLEKGKVVQVFLRTQETKGSKTEAMSLAKFQQKLTDSFDGCGILQRDFTNAAVTRFTLTPTVKEELEISSEKSQED